MTVLQVCAYGADYPGNFIASLTALESVLHEKGVQTIYAFVERARDKDWCQEICARTKVYFLPEAKARILPRTYQIFKKIYAENYIDIVHSHFELYDIPATITAPKHVKIFWHLHDALKRNYQFTTISRKLLTRIQYGLVGKRATLLSVSKEHAEFAQKIGFPKEQIEYMPNGIDLKRIQKNSHSTHEQTMNFLMFGWEVFRKGVDIITEVAETLDQECKIFVVGREECQTYLERYSHLTVLQYLKPSENINELYDKTHCFLHLSRAEGLSYALLEVIYAGIPVICSDIPENEFARVFHNVTFVDIKSVDEVESVIKRFIAGKIDLSNEGIKKNQEIIETLYSLESWSNSLLEIYMR